MKPFIKSIYYKENLRPLEIIRNDIVNMKVDAIVNSANSDPVVGSGVDAGIHKKAGPSLTTFKGAVKNSPDRKITHTVRSE